MRTLFFSLAGLFLASAVHATPKSILINKAPVRALFQDRLLNASKTNFKLTNRLDASDIGAKKGITQKAAQRARLGAMGMNNFIYGAHAENFVVGLGAKKLIVTRSTDKDYVRAPDYQLLRTRVVKRFIARDGQTGLVVGRGNLTEGKITWTRMKNSHAKNTPAERNAAANR